MSENQFKVGDVVVLKSGGPKMTVGAQLNSGWECTWFVNQECRKAHFQLAQLAREDAEPHSNAEPAWRVDSI